jgi:pilus assembly protein Flp/PilA
MTSHPTFAHMPLAACPARQALKQRPGEPDVNSNMLGNLRALLEDESGATAVEYGLIVAAIAGLIIVVVFLLGKKVNNAFSNVASHMP